MSAVVFDKTSLIQAVIDIAQNESTETVAEMYCAATGRHVNDAFDGFYDIDTKASTVTFND